MLHYPYLSYAARRPGCWRLFVRTDKQAPIAAFRAPAAAQGTPGLLSEQTSKRPRTKDFKPIATLPTAVLQFAAGTWTPWETFVRTDKQAPRKQRVSEHSPQLHYTHQPLRPWTPWETFVRTDKQAVIHRLSTVCGWLSTGYGRIKKRLTGFLRALVHVSSSAAQEPWSPVHMGSVFSPWTTNDST